MTLRPPRWLDPKIPVMSLVNSILILLAAGAFWVFTKDRNDVDLGAKIDKMGSELGTAISEAKGQVSSLQTSMNEQIRVGSVFATQVAQQGKEIDQLRTGQGATNDHVNVLDGRVQVLEALVPGAKRK